MQAGRRERNADTCNLWQSLVSQVGDDTAQSVHTIASDRRDDAKLGKMRGAVVKTGHRYESMRKALSTILLFVLLHDQALAETISSQPPPLSDPLPSHHARSRKWIDVDTICRSQQSSAIKAQPFERGWRRPGGYVVKYREDRGAHWRSLSSRSRSLACQRRSLGGFRSHVEWRGGRPLYFGSES